MFVPALSLEEHFATAQVARYVSFFVPVPEVFLDRLFRDPKVAALGRTLVGQRGGVNRPIVLSNAKLVAEGTDALEAFIHAAFVVFVLDQLVLNFAPSLRR